MNTPYADETSGRYGLASVKVAGGLYNGVEMINEHDIKDMKELNIQQPDITTTLQERGKRYGSFADHAIIAQRLKFAMWSTNGWERLHADQKQAIEVIADKIARILNGDPNYVDNWHDIQGYAKLVEDRLNENQEGRTS